VNIGIIVDGMSEQGSLPRLFGQIRKSTRQTLLRPVYAPIQPTAPSGATARACSSRIIQLKARGAERIIVLMDRENNADCCGVISADLQEAIKTITGYDAIVVVKDRAFENWLVSDPNALSAQAARFTLTRAALRAITPNKADRVDAYS
jgi:hypothetical protein